jgi:hypothetical protein
MCFATSWRRQTATAGLKWSMGGCSKERLPAVRPAGCGRCRSLTPPLPTISLLMISTCGMESGACDRRQELCVNSCAAILYMVHTWRAQGGPVSGQDKSRAGWVAYVPAALPACLLAAYRTCSSSCLSACSLGRLIISGVVRLAGNHWKRRPRIPRRQRGDPKQNMPRRSAGWQSSPHSLIGRPI